MYAHQEERSVESICYEQEHIKKVLEVIKATFPAYFDDFITCEGVLSANDHDIQKIADSLGVESHLRKKSGDKTQSYKNIIVQGIDDYEKDRQKYLCILDNEALEEYCDDPATFKSRVLKNECPIIQKTLNAHEKVLDKYKLDFRLSVAKDLLAVVTNLNNFAENYVKNVYNPDKYDNITAYTELVFADLDTEKCTYYGVIGGGIKSHLLYKKNPAVFPNRSRQALWALWYLSDKKAIDCKMDSEFLMINEKDSITQQNYFYPYQLFAFYAHQIHQLLKCKANKLDVYLNPEYRYVIVDSFLTFVAACHDADINLLAKQIKESDYGYM